MKSINMFNIGMENFNGDDQETTDEPTEDWPTTTDEPAQKFPTTADELEEKHFDAPGLPFPPIDPKVIIKDNNNTSSSPKNHNSTPTSIIVIIILVCLIFLGAIGYVFFKNYDKLFRKRGK